MYEVLISGAWVPTDNANIMGDGRLGFVAGKHRSVAKPPHWRHTEATTRDPKFREMCFNSLSQEEKELAYARIGLPQF